MTLDYNEYLKLISISNSKCFLDSNFLKFMLAFGRFLKGLLSMNFLKAIKYPFDYD